jgi:hypothetical protein
MGVQRELYTANQGTNIGSQKYLQKKRSGGPLLDNKDLEPSFYGSED